MPTIHFGQHQGRDLDRFDNAGYLAWVLTQNDGRAGEFAAWYGDEIRERIREIHRETGRRARALDSYDLNASQAHAAAVIGRELLRGDRSAFRLDGGAGYGKSFVTRDIAVTAKEMGWGVHAMAPSYVASQVLAQQLDGVADTGTIASVCRLSKVRDQDVETYEVTPDSVERMHEILAPGEAARSLVIVDEGSMVGDSVGCPLMEIAERVDGKLLVVGDRYQLPPVGQEHASPFYQIDGAVELDEPMRFSRDSDLYVLEQQARINPRGIHAFELPGSTEVVRHPDQGSLIAQYLADAEQHPEADARMLFFRRDDVAFANEAIRRHRYGPEADSTPIMQGEGVMVLETTDVGRASDAEGDDLGTRLYSGQTFHAVDVREDTVHGVPCTVADFHGVDRPVPLVFPGSETAAALQRRLAEIRAQVRDKSHPAKWRDFWRVKNAFLPVGYSYAMTVHRCQGQTVDRVYFDPRRLQGRQGAPLVYVAATRARRAVHMVR